MDKRRVTTRLIAGGSATAIWFGAFTGAAGPAQAGLIGNLLGVVTGTVAVVTTTTTTLLTNTLGGLLGNGWIVEDGRPASVTSPP